MTGDDLAYIERCVAAGRVRSPCLELGVGLGRESTCRQVVEAAGIEYAGTDLRPANDTAFVVDLEATSAEVRSAAGREFGTIICFNVLEHCFEPIRVLDNVFAILRPGGTCAIVTPTVWPLHDFPRDCYRLNPNFYEEYARRRAGVRLVPEFFEYLTHGPVAAFRGPDGGYKLPPPSPYYLKRLWSRAVHRLLRTTGRGLVSPIHLAIGCVFEKTQVS